MESLPINITDLIVVAILLISGILAFFRGLVHEVLSVSAWIGAGFATLYGYPLLTPYIMKVISSELVAQIVSGVVVFIGVLIIISLISHGLSKRVKQSALGALDRSLGFVFGLVRGAVLVCLCWLLLSWVLPAEERPEWVQEAKSLPLIEVGAEALAALVPEDIREESIEAVERPRNDGRGGAREGPGRGGPSDGRDDRAAQQSRKPRRGGQGGRLFRERARAARHADRRSAAAIGFWSQRPTP
jgi:membrane protein required for colicin V production